MTVFQEFRAALLGGLKPLGFAILAGCLVNTPASAQESQPPSDITEAGYALESDAADRIILAGRLRTLTQQVAAAACAYTSGVAVEESHEVLATATAQFDAIIVALRDGDEALHILAPETDGRILRDIQFLEEEWKLVHAAIDSVLGNQNDTEGAHFIDDHNMRLLELTEKLTADVTNRHSRDNDMAAADALMVEIASRQLMLSQQMAKNACEIWTDYHSGDARTALGASVQSFDVALNALHDGLAAAGLPAAPTPEIAADLRILLDRWAILKPNLDTLVSGGDLEMEQKVEIFHDLQLELVDLRHLVDDYRDYAERHSKES